MITNFLSAIPYIGKDLVELVWGGLENSPRLMKTVKLDKDNNETVGPKGIATDRINSGYLLRKVQNVQSKTIN